MTTCVLESQIGSALYEEEDINCPGDKGEDHSKSNAMEVDLN